MTAKPPALSLAARIVLLRGQRVLIDADLAALYGVETRRLNEQVRRNRQRFPADFIFEVSQDEFSNLMSQNATSSWGGRRKLPLAFTEHGAIMAATILNSPRAVEMSVFVVRAFIEFRQLLSRHEELAQHLRKLEGTLVKHDKAIAAIIDAIRELTVPRQPETRPIGFVTNAGEPSKQEGEPK